MKEKKADYFLDIPFLFNHHKRWKDFYIFCKLALFIILFSKEWL